MEALLGTLAYPKREHRSSTQSRHLPWRARVKQNCFWDSLGSLGNAALTFANRPWLMRGFWGPICVGEGFSTTTCCKAASNRRRLFLVDVRSCLLEKERLGGSVLKPNLARAC